MPREVWATAVLLAAAGFVRLAAQPLAPVGPPPSSNATNVAPAPSGRPLPVLGAPVAVKGEPVVPASPEPSPAPPPATAAPAGYIDPPARSSPTRAAGFGAPTSAAPVPAAAVETPPRTTDPRPDPVNEFLARRSDYKDKPERGKPVGSVSSSGSSGKINDFIDSTIGPAGERFRSDHCFDGFISPISNPFLAEDPRSLTEVRPIFIYQKIPNGQNDFQGGNTSFFGVQGRVAITERWSFVFNKLGGIWLNPSANSSFGDESGFAELWLGPKYTFLRWEDTGSLVAGGLQFQVPVGSRNAYQHTGTLSLVPYITYGQNFLRDLSIGSFNGIIVTGYSASVNNDRSSYWYLTAHLDLDIANAHRFYPVMELNYFLYTTNGNTLPIGTEGRDLYNFGGQAKGQGLLTGAIGGRVKITESAQLGGTFEIPFAGPKGLFQYRFTLDFILRY